MDKNPVLYDYFKKQTELLLSMYENSKQQKASYNLGINRENILNNFLSGNLPNRLKFVNGEIIDSKGTHSGQIDIIIFRDDTPSLNFFGSNTYIIEGVLAVVEVKSKLTRKSLNSAINTLKKVEVLEPKHHGMSLVGPIINQNDENDMKRKVIECPLRMIFAYESASWDLILNEIDKNQASELIDYIGVLNRGAIHKNGLWFNYNFEDNVDFVIYDNPVSSLALLYFFLSNFSSSILMRFIDMSEYFLPIQKFSKDNKFIGCKIH
ncbi:MAG: hypothetical protein K8R40_00190 [Anaerolineaceae bacterium]|nr:hypothetical protein [Anaerolineaceae bacterium]